MTTNRTLLLLAGALVFAACGMAGDESTDPDSAQPDAPAEPAQVEVEAAMNAAFAELAPGLTMRILREGDGATAQAGDIAIVHYTGWLYDETAQDNRGTKFDSSLDRDQHFQFPLGAGRVIRGWDQGVVGMKEGEKRELVIGSAMAYGERGAGNVIPPGATLVFEVELAKVQRVQPQTEAPPAPGSSQ